MKAFMDEDFLLESGPARTLYREYAETMPIVDYHCHIDPREIAEDRRYSSITELWLGGDHYKWRLMRANGAKEEQVTGALKRDPYLAFEEYAAALPRAIGNPVYHWTHLELKRYFGIDTPLTPATAREIYAACNRKLAEPAMSVRGIIAQSNVRLLCTTDDPADDLSWHKKIAADASCAVKVLPAFRPDKALNIDRPGFREYMERLGGVCGFSIQNMADLRRALAERIEYFAAMGCRASDHALERGIYAEASEGELDAIFQKALEGGSIAALEAEQFRTALLLHLAERYSALEWVMQLHFGCRRDNNSRMLERLGPDTGFDCLNGEGNPIALSRLFDRLDSEGILPRMVLYSLNPADSEILVSLAGCFLADAECPGKVQVGSAWWFNDSKAGMEKQLADFANGTLLGNFVGMLTDSRSFLSYTRHEYFRRILCNFLGSLVERGEYPAAYDSLGGMVQDICYHNAMRFFNFPNERVGENHA